MRGKKARAQRKALKRSGDATRSRLARKADGVSKNEAERAFDVELGGLKRTRDESLRLANLEHEKVVLEADRALTIERKLIDKQYDDARNALVKKSAAQEAKAA